MLIASSNFLVPGPTFVVELAIFLVTLWALSKWVLPSVNGIMDARQQAIERNINDAEEAKKRALELEEQHKKLLEQGREEARTLKDEAAKIGEQLREDLRKQGEEEYRRLVERAERRHRSRDPTRGRGAAGRSCRARHGRGGKSSGRGDHAAGPGEVGRASRSPTSSARLQRARPPRPAQR